MLKIFAAQMEKKEKAAAKTQIDKYRAERLKKFEKDPHGKMIKNAPKGPQPQLLLAAKRDKPPKSIHADPSPLTHKK